jgi:O-antigen/teichoic acid export membrane protein
MKSPTTTADGTALLEEPEVPAVELAPKLATELATNLANQAAEPSIPAHVTKNLVSGTSALGLGVIIERGFGFLSNVLAARLGGASTFGVYSLAISMASNISTYAAGGIGSTATRFSGEYPRGSAGYPTLGRVLALVTTVSALAAALVMWIGAVPISRLLEKPSLTGVLQWAAFSGAGMILVECARGFFIGQKRLKALLLLSVSVGIGMVTLLPIAAHVGPVAMICSQSAAALGAVVVCLLCYRPLGLASPVRIEKREPIKPMLKQVWSFGFVQLAGLVGMNAAGWWLTSLVAKSDVSMMQMGFFAVAHQLRNMVALGPSLLAQASLAEMADRGNKAETTPENVMATCTFVSTLVSLALAGVGIIVVPWGLTVMYGKTYSGAELATAIALATAVPHMGSSPVGARLWIVSLRASGLINTAWAALVALGATAVLFHGGNAAKGAGVYLAAHLLSAGLQIGCLKRRGSMPRGVITVFGLGTTCAIALAMLAFVREIYSDRGASISILMLGLLLSVLTVMFFAGRRHNWIPSMEAIRAFLAHTPILDRLRGR